MDVSAERIHCLDLSVIQKYLLMFIILKATARSVGQSNDASMPKSTLSRSASSSVTTTSAEPGSTNS